MSEYDAVISTFRELGLSWTDLDRIELHDETYADFSERSNFPSGRSTDGPAVRVTNGPEQIVYVDANGELVEVSIE